MPDSVPTTMGSDPLASMGGAEGITSSIGNSGSGGGFGDMIGNLFGGSSASTGNEGLPTGGFAGGMAGILPGEHDFPGGTPGLGGIKLPGGVSLPGGIGGIGGIIGAVPAIMGMFNKSPTEKYLEQAQRLGMSNARAASNAGQAQLGQYQQGQLSPTQKAAADRYEQEQLAKWRQYLASAGIPEGSAMADITNKVHQDRLVYEQQLLQQNFQNSMSALGLGGNQLAQQSAINLRQNQEIAQSQAQAMGALGQLFGILFPGNA